MIFFGCYWPLPGGRLCRAKPTVKVLYDDNRLHRFCPRHAAALRADHPEWIFEKLEKA